MPYHGPYTIGRATRMRILVLAQSRSGSTGFQAWLKKEFNEPAMVEPLNPYANTPEQLEEQVAWIKSDRGLILKFVDNMFLKHNELWNPRILINYFDKAIGLTREDDRACAYSRLIGDITGNWRGNVDTSNIDQQTIDEHIHKLDGYIEEAQKHKEFIQDLPLFQVTYEQIYHRKDISGLLDYLSVTPQYLDYLFENKNISNNWNF